MATIPSLAATVVRVQAILRNDDTSTSGLGQQARAIGACARLNKVAGECQRNYWKWGVMSEWLRIVLLGLLGIAATVPAQGQSSGNSSSLYVSIMPAFVVNLQSKKRARYLQVVASLKAEDEESIEVVRHHVGAVRHYVLMTLSGRKSDAIRTVDEKNSLRLDVLNALHAVLHGGKLVHRELTRCISLNS
jgi:flagellar basal body-associated protein FliL